MRDLTRWAEGERAKGVSICICAQGTVDIPVPENLLTRQFAPAAALPEAHRYPPQLGSRDLRASFLAHLNDWERIATALTIEDPTGEARHQGNLLVTSGVNGGVIAALHHVRERYGATANCAVFDPSYLYHDLDVLAVFGRGAVHFKPREDFTFDRQAVESALVARSIQALVVCNPANPNGLLLNDEEIQWLIDIAGQNDAIVIFDEVYAHIQEAGQTFRSPLHVLETIPKHVVVIRGWSKLLGLQSDRLGCLIAHEEVIPRILRWHDILYIGVNGAGQAALARYLHSPDDLVSHAASLNRTITENARVIGDAFAQALGWKLLQTDRVGRSTIYRMLSHDRATDLEAMLVALQRGVAAAPGNLFWPPSNRDPVAGVRIPNTGTLRLSLAMPTAAVTTGAAQLRSGKTIF